MTPRFSDGGPDVATALADDARWRPLWRVIEARQAGDWRPRTGDVLSEGSAALAERVKELQCLHSISKMLKDRPTDLGEILQEIVEFLPSAWQFPELATASILLEGRRYATRGSREPRWRHTAEIVLAGRRAGVLEIGYTRPLPDGREPAFLPEERSLLSTVAAWIAELVALKEAEHQLTSYEHQLRSLAAELTLAEERERRSLAMNLHDRIGQGLAIAKLKLETLKCLLPSEHHGRMEDIAALIKEIVNDTRSLTFDISPPILYELGLESAVVWLGEHVTRQFALRVDVRGCPEPVALTEGAQVMLFRSIQELLTNAVKHAHASRATVTLLNVQDGLCAVVADDGCGFDARGRARLPSAGGGFGLFSIQERIRHLGGRVDIESAPGHGTTVRLTVPAAPGPDGPERCR